MSLYQAPVKKLYTSLTSLIPTRSYLALLSIVLMTAACQDPPPSFDTNEETFTLPPQMSKDMFVSSVDSSMWNEPNEDMARIADQEVMADMDTLLPEVSWVELTLSPARIYYRLSETPQVQALAFDPYGQNLDLPVRFEFLPTDTVAIDMQDDGNTRLTLLAEGEVLMKACVGGIGETFNDQIMCAERSLIIDDRLPQVTVHWPSRGAMIHAEDPWPNPYNQEMMPEMMPEEEIPQMIGDMIPIYGEVIDSQENLIVKVNQEIVTLEAGRFATMIPAQFGYNRIEIIADDQVRNQIVSDIRWVLWSPALGEFLSDKSYIEDGLRFRIDQSFLDADQVADMSTSPLQAQELAEFLTIIINLIQPMNLIPNTTLIESEAFSLSIEEIELGEPLIDLRFSEQGISLFAGFNQLTLSTSGMISLAGGELSLDGSIVLGVASFAELAISSTSQRPLAIDVLETAVSITSIDANFEDASSEALIEALDTQARILVSELIDDVFEELITSQIPILLETSVYSILNTIREVPINLDASSLGLPVLSLSMLVNPHSIASQEASDADLVADVEIVHNNPVIESEVNRRGYPSMTSQDELPNHNSSFSFHLKFDVINALLAEVWRGGLLSLVPPLPAETQALVSEAYIEALSPPVIKVAPVTHVDPLVLQIAGLIVKLSGNFAPEVDEYEIFVEAGMRIIIDNGSFSFQLEEEPIIKVVIAVQRNEVPVIPTEILERVFLYSIWPSLNQSLSDEIRLGLSAATLSRQDFSNLGIILNEGTITPIFLDRIKTSGGWISLEGGIEVNLVVQP